MQRFPVFAGLLCLAVCSLGQQGATPSKSAAISGSYSDDISHIVGTIMTRGGASAFLEMLTDTVGGRVTGSPECKAAADLILRTLKQGGYDTAHFEEYTLESRWKRGPATGRVVSPVDRPLFVGSYAWVPGTAGRIEAQLVDLGAATAQDIQTGSPNVRGAAVIVEPREVPGTPSIVQRALIAKQLAETGAAVMVIPSDKPNRMVYTSAFGFFPRGVLPVISVAREDSLFLRRLLAKGPVKVALDVQNSFDMSASLERNVVAELPGSDPGGIVLLGAHFDSWDPAQGANDDGSGVAAVLEAARVMKSLGIKPRHTIRFVFFSGEEEALLGSRAYVRAHQSEMDKFRAAIIMDEGAQAPHGFEVQSRTDLKASLEATLAPLAPLGANHLSLEGSFDQDHAPFLAVGVPAMTLWVDPGEYDIHHHSITDTFDKVDPRMLSLDSAVMAVAAYLIANADQAPGARLPQSDVDQLLNKMGLESTYRAVYQLNSH